MGGCVGPEARKGQVCHMGERDGPWPMGYVGGDHEDSQSCLGGSWTFRTRVVLVTIGVD